MEMNVPDPVQMDIPNDTSTSAALLRACEDNPVFDDLLQLGTDDTQAFESLLYMPAEQDTSFNQIEIFNNYSESHPPEPQRSQNSYCSKPPTTIPSPDHSVLLTQWSQSTTQNSIQDIADVPPLSAHPDKLFERHTYQENRLQHIAPATYPPGSTSPRAAHRPVSSHATPSQNSNAELPSTSSSSNSASVKYCLICAKSFSRQSDLRCVNSRDDKPTGRQHTHFQSSSPLSKMRV